MGQTRRAKWPIPHNSRCCLSHLPVVWRLEHLFQLAVFEGRIFASANAPFFEMKPASGKCCIYIWHFCKQLRYIIDKQKIHLEKSNNFAWYHPTKEHIQPIEAHFQAILCGTHLMHPPWLQPLHLLPFVVMWFCVGISNTSHFYNNKVDSRFTRFSGFIDSD